MYNAIWKETIYFPPDIANHDDEVMEILRRNVIMKCHRCKNEFNDLKNDVYIKKDKLRCKNCDVQLNKENAEEYLKLIKTNIMVTE